MDIDLGPAAYSQIEAFYFELLLVQLWLKYQARSKDSRSQNKLIR